jgi:hypothetical protein
MKEPHLIIEQWSDEGTALRLLKNGVMKEPHFDYWRMEWWRNRILVIEQWSDEAIEGGTVSFCAILLLLLFLLPFISFSLAVFCYLDDQAMQVAVMLHFSWVFSTQVVNKRWVQNHSFSRDTYCELENKRDLVPGVAWSQCGDFAIVIGRMEIMSYS